MSCNTPVIVDQCPGGVLVAEGGCDVVVTEQERAVVVVAPGEQGPPGRPGIPGPAGGQVLQRTAGQDLSALLVVYEDMFAQVWPADAAVEADVLALLGVTVTAAQGGQAVNVQRLGVIDDGGWSWAPGRRVYLAGQGRLTQDPPQDGFFVLIGTALAPSRLLLNFQDPIRME